MGYDPGYNRTLAVRVLCRVRIEEWGSDSARGEGVRGPAVSSAFTAGHAELSLRRPGPRAGGRPAEADPRLLLPGPDRHPGPRRPACPSGPAVRPDLPRQPPPLADLLLLGPDPEGSAPRLAVLRRHHEPRSRRRVVLRPHDPRRDRQHGDHPLLPRTPRRVRLRRRHGPAGAPRDRRRPRLERLEHRPLGVPLPGLLLRLHADAERAATPRKVGAAHQVASARAAHHRAGTSPGRAPRGPRRARAPGRGTRQGAAQGEPGLPPDLRERSRPHPDLYARPRDRPQRQPAGLRDLWPEP